MDYLRRPALFATSATLAELLAASRCEGVAGDYEAPGQLIAAALSQPDSNCLSDLCIAEFRSNVVFSTPEPAASKETRAVVVRTDTHRLSQSCGPGSQQPVVGDSRPSFSHRLDACDGLAGAQ